MPRIFSVTGNPIPLRHVDNLPCEFLYSTAPGDFGANVKIFLSVCRALLQPHVLGALFVLNSTSPKHRSD